MGAWIETLTIRRIRLSGAVAPLWERGLKLLYPYFERHKHNVAPLWERGLKLVPSHWKRPKAVVAPLWERGLKQSPVSY